MKKIKNFIIVEKIKNFIIVEKIIEFIPFLIVSIGMVVFSVFGFGAGFLIRNVVEKIT